MTDYLDETAGNYYARKDGISPDETKDREKISDYKIATNR